jgi:hypothetical protein
MKKPYIKKEIREIVEAMVKAGKKCVIPTKDNPRSTFAGSVTKQAGILMKVCSPNANAILGNGLKKSSLTERFLE